MNLKFKTQAHKIVIDYQNKFCENKHIDRRTQGVSMCVQLYLVHAFVCMDHTKILLQNIINPNRFSSPSKQFRTLFWTFWYYTMK